MNTGSTSPVAGYVIAGIGGLLVLIAIVWAGAVGFFASDLPMLIGLFVVGGGLLWIGQRMFKAARRRHVEQRIAERGTEN